MKFLFTGDVNFRGHENLDYDKSTQILSEVIPYTRKVDFVIPNLECPLADKEKLKLYFMGWTWNHPWCPVVPNNFYEIEGFNASGNYDLVKCEAHAAQTKQLLEIFHNVEMDVAKEMEQKVLDLQKMPI